MFLLLHLSSFVWEGFLSVNGRWEVLFLFFPSFIERIVLFYSPCSIPQSMSLSFFPLLLRCLGICKPCQGRKSKGVFNIPSIVRSELIVLQGC